MIEGWRKSTLGEACVIERGRASAANEPQGPYPLVTTGVERKSAATWQFMGPAVCVPMISAYGHGKPGLRHVHYQEGKFALANILSALLVKSSEELSPKFLATFLNFYKDHLIVPLQFGAANMSITVERLASVPIWYPSLDEQERILCLLDEADILRKLRLQASTRMEEFVPALFHEMFGDPVKNEKGWSVLTVNSFVKEFQAGRSILTDGLETEETRYRVLKVSAVTWGEYKPFESKPVPKEYVPLFHHFVRAGDLLFSRANTTELVGATVFVFDTPPNRLLSDKLWRFVWQNPNEIEPLYVWALFQNSSVRYELGQRATGTGGSMKNISQSKVLSMQVPLPPLDLQREFARRVQEAREIQSRQAQSAERIEALYQSMLSRAFAGEL